MKLTTAAVLAFIAISVLGKPVSFKATAVPVQDLYERGGGEGSLQSFERRGGLGPSLFSSIADMFGTMGGRVASTSAQDGLSKHFFPPSKPKPAPKSPPHYVLLARRSLGARVKRRAFSRPVARKHIALA